MVGLRWMPTVITRFSLNFSNVDSILTQIRTQKNRLEALPMSLSGAYILNESN